MSNAYYQGYGTQSNNYPPPYPEQMSQNFPQPYSEHLTQHVPHSENLTQHVPQSQGWPGYPTLPSYGTQNVGFQPVSEEYLRQPANAPAAAAVVEPEPRVIIVHNNTNEPHWCPRFCCECITSLLERICCLITVLVICAVAIGLLVYFLKFYRKHH